jgi:hypothetical protein
MADPSHEWLQEHRFGPFTTLGPLAYTAWMFAAAAWAWLPVRWVRPAVAVATVITVALPALDAVTRYTAPTYPVIMTLATLGVVAFVAAPADSSASRRRRLLPVMIGSLVVTSGVGLGLGEPEFYLRTLAAVTLLGVVPLAIASVLAAFATRTERGLQRLIPAAVLLAVGERLGRMCLPDDALPWITVLVYGSIALVVLVVVLLPPPRFSGHPMAAPSANPMAAPSA